MPNMKMRLISICNFRVESKCDRRSRNMNYCAQYFYFYYYYLFPLGFISVAMQHFVVRFWWAKWQDDFFSQSLMLYSVCCMVVVQHALERGSQFIASCLLQHRHYSLQQRPAAMGCVYNNAM